MRTGRAGQRAGPGWPFTARGPNGPKTGRKAFQDENKLHMKNQNFCKNHPKIYFFLKKSFKKFFEGFALETPFINYIRN